MRDGTTDALPGARAAVLARLWGALHREPVDGIAGRTVHAGALTLTLADGRAVTADAAAAAPFAVPPVPFTVTLAGRPYDDPGALLRALRLPGATDRYAAELDDSVANLALPRAAQPPPDGGPPALPRPLPHAAGWEQLVVDGHPLHPACRTRLGMTPDEVRRYGPEHRPVVDLVEVAVPADWWLTTGAGLPPARARPPRRSPAGRRRAGVRPDRRVRVGHLPPRVPPAPVPAAVGPMRTPPGGRPRAGRVHRRAVEPRQERAHRPARISRSAWRRASPRSAST
jgi:hypothetical protein